MEGASRKEVVDILKEDIYYKQGVWDLENVKVIPMRLSIVRALQSAGK
jgi:hypothetical protein